MRKEFESTAFFPVLSKLLAVLLVSMIVSHMQATEPEAADVNGIEPLPTSPTAASLGNYGNIDVGLHTGTVQYSIPIYSFKTRNLEVPISLNYSSNGIKVDQLASWVGMGWNLSAGGVISRNIMGSADEYSQNDIPNFRGTITAQMIEWLHLNANEPAYDSESDIYTFSFPGYSGTFIYNYSSEEFYTVKHSPLKIEKTTILDNFGFKITAPDGIIYYFEDREITGYFGATHPMLRENTVTSWYLSEIEHPSGESIQFHYRNLSNPYTYESGPVQTYTQSTTSLNCDSYGCCDDLTDYDDPDYNQVHVQPLALDSITCQGIGRVAFISSEGGTARKDIPDFRLDSIKVYHSVDQDPIREFKFSYSDVKALTSYTNVLHSYGGSDSHLFYRLFLDSVEEPGKGQHAFQYYSRTSLAPRLSFAQDHWGYFNGVQNPSFVGTPPAQYIKSGIDYADKEPDSDYSVRGILKEVTYPTGGKTTFTYEGHKYLKPVYPTPSTTINTVVANSITSGEVVEMIEIDSVDMNQLVEFDFTVTHCEAGGCSSIDPDFDYYGVVEIYNSLGYLEYYDSISFGPPDFISGFNNVVKTGDFEYYFIENNSYTIKVRVSGDPMESYLYYVTESDPQTPTSYVAAELGGVRIKKVESSETSETKYYYYNSYANRTTENSIFYSKPQYHTFFNAVKCDIVAGQPPGPTVERLLECPHMSFHSSSVKSLFGGTSHVYYNYVTVSHGGEDFEDGGEQYSFDNTLDVQCQIINNGSGISSFNSFSVPKSNTSWNSGTLLNNRKFKVVNDQQVMVQETSYSYAYQDLDTSTQGSQEDDRDLVAYVFRKNYEHCGSQQTGVYQLEQFDIFAYDIYSRWKPLVETTTTTYDTNGQNGVETSEAFTYYNPDLADPYKIVRTESDDIVHTTINKYCADYSSSLSTPGSFLESLKNDKRTGELIESQMWVDGKFTAGTLNKFASNLKHLDIYTLYTDNPVPLTISSPPFSELEPDLSSYSYASYDKEVEVKMNDYLKPIQIIRTSDSPSSYSWGYNDLYPAVVAQNISSIVLEAAISNALPTGYSNLEALCQAIVDDPTDLSDWDDFNEDLRSASTLSDALITTYTYSPLVGMTSQTDPNGLTTSYEYDDFGRLKLIRDHEDNILQEYEYNYAQ